MALVQEKTGPAVVTPAEGHKTMRTNGDTADKGIAQADRFELLSSKRRIWVLQLLEQKGVMTKGRLAEAIAGYENDGLIKPQDRKRVYVSLHQSHIPKLEDYDVIETEGRNVWLTERADQLLQYIEPQEDRQWWRKVLSA